MGQKNQLWWDLPAGDSFQLHREIYSLPPDAFERTLGELTELFGVEKLTRQPVRELSLGERMKMELIAALLHEPQLLLLDEPTIGLDVVAQVAIQHCLKEYNATRGVTMLLTSHYMRDVEALCPRVLVIAHGRVIYDGPLAGITEQFGKTKLVQLQFAGEDAPAGLERFGEVSVEGPVAELKVDRARVGRGAGRHSGSLHGGGHERTGPAAGSGHRPRLRGGPCRPRGQAARVGRLARTLGGSCTRNAGNGRRSAGPDGRGHRPGQPFAGRGRPGRGGIGVI